MDLQQSPRPTLIIAKGLVLGNDFDRVEPNLRVLVGECLPDTQEFSVRTLRQCRNRLEPLGGTLNRCRRTVGIDLRLPQQGSAIDPTGDY